MTFAEKILVTGGTGNTGTALAARLRQADVPVRTASRHAANEADRETRGAASEHVRFDWADEATFGPALEGIARVYLVAPVLDDDPVRRVVPFLRRALDRGVRRAVLLSSSAIPEGGPALGKVHQAVREMMPEWSVLQPSWFMQNFTGPMHGASIKASGEIVTATGAGKVGFVDTRDIAEVAFRALTDAAPHNRAHLITGPQALSYAEAAAIISEAAQKPVCHVSISGAQLSRRLAEAGIPASYAALLAGLDEAIKHGAEDRVTSTVLDVTGRPSKAFGDFARDNAGAWR